MLKILLYAHWFLILWTGYDVWSQKEVIDEEIIMAKSQLPVHEKSIKKKEKELKNLESYYADIEKAKERIDKVAGQVESLQKQLPDNILDTDNLDFFSKIAEGINLKGISLKPGTQETHGFYITKEYIFKASGTFLQFVLFLEKLSDSKRLFNVSNLRIAKLNQNQKGRFQIVNGEVVIIAYRYNKNHRENRGIDEIERKFK